MSSAVHWAIVVAGCWVAVSLAAGAVWSVLVTEIKRRGRVEGDL
jgi:hypothetical protein